MIQDGRWARLVLRVLAALVPWERRGEWREEWEAELSALVALRREGRADTLPGVGRFVAGALPHALWIRTEGWTVDSVVQDLRYAARVLRRSPGFTLVAALTLALGIGANSAMFSLVNGLLLRAPAGIQEPERLVQIARSYDSAPRWDNWSWPAFEIIGRESSRLSGVAGYATSSFLLGEGEDTEAVLGEYVSGGYFSLLGVRPALGRLLDPSDEVAPGSHPVVVLGHGLWSRRFGADPRVVGSTVRIGAVPYEVVGVAPEGFVGVESLGSVPDLWVPAYQRTAGGQLPFAEWGHSWFSVLGRLGDGVSFEAARASMDVVTTRLREAWPDNEDIRVLVAPGIGLSPEERAEGRGLMLLLSGIALLIFLLTCANVGSLFLTRAATREGEVGVRKALGAGGGRLARQWITESVVLAGVATALTVPLVLLASRALPSLFPYRMAVSVAPDARVYLFLASVGLAAGLLFGVAPAWVVSRRDAARALREGGSAGGGRRRTRLRDALVVGQLAISVGLVSGAALLGRSVLNARGADPGFDPDGLLVGFVNLYPTGRYEGQAVVDFQTRLLEELRALPGVTSAALAGQAPVLGGHSRSTVRPAELPEDTETRFEAEYTVVTPGYFETLGVRLLRGRDFREPTAEAEPVVIVNESLARMFWPGEEAVGKYLSGRRADRRVIGVVADVQMRSLRAPGSPGAYYPYHQAPGAYFVPHLRTRGSTAALAPELRRAVATVDPEIPVTGVTDLRDGLARSLSEVRTFGLVVSTFAGLALVLSLVGLYGLIAHGVSQRARELGIRIALGAGSRALVRLVLVRALALAAGGVALGVGVALTLGRALQGVLFGVSPSSPAVVAGAALLMAAAAVLAAWVPARKASRLDAMVSLRD